MSTNPLASRHGSVSILDFGAVPDGETDCAPSIQAALDSGARHVVVPGGIFLIRNSLFPHEGQCVEIHGTLKIADAIVRPLLEDVAAGDSSVTVEDASRFHAGQTVILHDEQLPIQGGGRKVRRERAGAAKILSISDNKLSFAVKSARSYLRQRNGIVATMHSAIMIHHSGVRVCGTGTIDCNKANQFNACPGFLEREDGEGDIGCGIAVAAYPGRLENVIIEGVTIVDPVLHGVRMKDCDRGIVRNTICLRAHDKNMSFQRLRECSILHNHACDSEWEDGILFHQKADPELCSSHVLIHGNICSGNARNGIGVGAGMSGFHLSDNFCVNNGVNFSLRGDDIVSNNDAATGCNTRIFPLEKLRASVITAGRKITLNNLTVRDGPSIALALGGSDIIVSGGRIGDMDLHHEENSGIGIDLAPVQRASKEPLLPPSRVRISGLVVSGCRKALRIHPKTRDAMFINNSFEGCESLGEIPGDDSMRLVFGDNEGLVSKNRGQTAIVASDSRIRVTHGLFRAPDASEITVIPMGSLGECGRFWIDNVSKETFDIVLDRPPGSHDVAFTWLAGACHAL